jgi:hypothetical protein
VDSTIYMVPYTVGKAPNIFFRMCDGHNFVYNLLDISGCMNDRRNKDGHTGVDI